MGIFFFWSKYISEILKAVIKKILKKEKKNNKKHSVCKYACRLHDTQPKNAAMEPDRHNPINFIVKN